MEYNSKWLSPAINLKTNLYTRKPGFLAIFYLIIKREKPQIYNL